MNLPPEIECSTELAHLEQLLMYEYHGLEIHQQREAGRCFSEAIRLLNADEDLITRLGRLWPRVEDVFCGSLALRSRTEQLTAAGLFSQAESEVEAAYEIATEAVEAIRAFRHRLHEEVRS
ncbi:hypothetical protein DES53_102484 [Roseimicrobium gellanilyticum]|uniref:Uncharacterized protein n=1 Tax=Roseimicrobium gellanilyticum TaxID=748857 RepID=A0A366HSL7_9BACT|nr:hypothetical protein [Roseimicrobium gellanilyticum]RBP46098.1 hypothetical protein DES53_102484 [Roseimicrobium gellanilyticum]